MKKFNKIKCLLTLLISALSFTTYADVVLPRLVSNGMVLQRDENLKIWGWANENEKISISFLNKNYETVADKSGNWEVQIPKQKAGGPYQMTINGDNQIVIDDILFGDVWICSGQSNMELPITRVKVAYPGLVESSENDNIRHFAVNTTYEFNEQRQDFQTGDWKKATPENVEQFSAVGYFFAKSLYEKYQVPIGLIRIAVGGSPAEAWLSESTIKAKYPNFNTLLEKYKNKDTVASIIANDRAAVDNWNKNIDANDLGLLEEPKWRDNDLDFKEWKTFTVPGLWEKNPFIEDAQESQLNVSGRAASSGVIWFKKEIQVTKEQLGKDNLLVLGVLVDRDEVFVNGKFVGSTGYQYPPRRYKVPSEVLKEGKNIITVRLVSNNGNGGFVPDKHYGLTLGNDTIPLTGEWKYKVGYSSPRMPAGQVTFHYQPSSLFNAMVSPLKNYGNKGVIWYQGESNTSNPKEYENSFADVILDWRKHFSDPKMPFLFVQLANFMEESDQPQESNWAETREVQRKTLRIPNTAMVVLTDAGEWNDIHPLDKKTVGDRLALAARNQAYGDKKVVYSGPALKSYKIKGNKFILQFDHVGSGLTTRDNEALQHFAIADESGKFHWAKAEIKGRNVIVWNDSISNPTRLRYGWSHNPLKANLYNKEGLPASPFEIHK